MQNGWRRGAVRKSSRLNQDLYAEKVYGLLTGVPEYLLGVATKWINIEMYWKVSTEILNCIMGQLSVIIVCKCLQQFKEDTFKVSITNSF